MKTLVQLTLILQETTFIFLHTAAILFVPAVAIAIAVAVI